MNKLTNQKPTILLEVSRTAGALEELSEHEVASVVGGACRWFEFGQGWAWHGGYVENQN